MQSLPTLTRRTLLRAGTVTVTASLVGLRPWAPAPAAAAPGHLLRSSYVGLEGESFRVGSVDLQLLSVDDLAGAEIDKSVAGSEDAFALAFSGPLAAPFASGTHSVTHPALGTFELFVSAVARPRWDRRYEAVIDRSVPRTGSRRVSSSTARRGRAPSAASR